MIRVHKDSTVPSSLLTTQRYGGDDVISQLLLDQHEKCYICERKLKTDDEIEHLRSQVSFHELRQDWNNLFLACGYCNKRKLNHYDDILCPKDINIEEEIKHELSFSDNKAIFTPLLLSVQHKNTVVLLNRIFNGKNNHPRTIREERFFEYALSEINSFYELTIGYLRNKTLHKKKEIKDELAFDKEFLGFKYWIIRDNPDLLMDFENDIIWNKIY